MVSLLGGLGGGGLTDDWHSQTKLVTGWCRDLPPAANRAAVT